MVGLLQLLVREEGMDCSMTIPTNSFRFLATLALRDQVVIRRVVVRPLTYRTRIWECLLSWHTAQYTKVATRGTAALGFDQIGPEVDS